MRIRRGLVWTGGLAAWVMAALGTARGEDAFFRIPLVDLPGANQVFDSPAAAQPPGWSLRPWERLFPYADVEGGGEAYVDLGEPPGWPWDRTRLRVSELVVRVPGANAATGRVVVPKPDLAGMAVLRFSLPASAARADARDAFYQGKRRYYEYLLSLDIPGGAWFRHQARDARLALHVTPASNEGRGPARRGARPGELVDTYELFSGGRAMSENLQLDRVLPRVQPNESPVKLDAIRGITIQEIDWQPLLQDARPKLDPLASAIPADQHAVFFPSFQAALALADEAAAHDTPLLRAAQPRSEDARVVERYQRQLGLPLSQLARLVGPQVAKSVALTGSDPFFPTGTDVAVLFETAQPAILENLLLARIGLEAKDQAAAQWDQGEVAGLRYRAVRSPDRSLSSYVARLDAAVVVTNSPAQLRRLGEVHGKRAKSIASLPEYSFFRHRYPLGDPSETAFVFLSDATIRRWCGPRWRIADSRRTRAAAVLAELQASQLESLVRGQVKPGPLPADWSVPEAGAWTLGPGGAASSTYGSLRFMTPISEIPLEQVSKAEADAYEQWRDGYQRNWSWAFDPIALRIGVNPKGLSADMTVMPLIAGTQYREMISVSQGAAIPPGAGDRHDALAHFLIALNRQSRLFEQANTIASGLTQGASLGWIGRTFEVYVDDDPFFGELARQKPSDLERFLPEHIGRLPVAVRIESSNSLRLAAFLTALRAVVEQTAPGLTRWESLNHEGLAYVKISAAGEGGGLPAELRTIALYYAALPDALTVTLNEKVLHRALDRAAANEKAKREGQAPSKTGGGLFARAGGNVALSVDRKMLEIANHLARDEYQAMMQAACWSNLPILNEWKRRYPDRDPVEVHRLAWQTTLVCPGGGKYVWNDRYATMESTVYGHPGEPKRGPAAPPVLGGFRKAEFRLTFEPQGLRAEAALTRD